MIPCLNLKARVVVPLAGLTICVAAFSKLSSSWMPATGGKSNEGLEKMLVAGKACGGVA